MSTLTQFLPVSVGGGLKSFQTGYVGVTPSTGSGEDTRFTDVTISSVNTAKAIPGFFGSMVSTGNIEALYSWDGTSASAAIVMPRLTSGTNLRLSANHSYAATFRLSGRWQVAEAN